MIFFLKPFMTLPHYDIETKHKFLFSKHLN